jgi:putative acetyltransferase
MKDIEKSTSADWPALMDIWELAVLASHDFLHPADLAFYRRRIYHEYFPELELYHIKDKAGCIAGFIGVHENTLEMLFIRPDSWRLGLGARFVDFAISEGAYKVEVNEENEAALAFYRKMGYVETGHSVVKSPNKRYPLIHMERR